MVLFSFQNDYQNDWVYNLALNPQYRGKLTYVVEMFVIVDNSIYQRSATNYNDPHTTPKSHA